MCMGHSCNSSSKLDLNILSICRNEVLAWLASIGAEHMVPAKKATNLPTMTEDDWLRLQPKAAKAAVAAKEAAEKPSQTAAKSKEIAPKAKEFAPKAKETAASKPKGRPRYDQMSALYHERSCWLCTNAVQIYYFHFAHRFLCVLQPLHS